MDEWGGRDDGPSRFLCKVGGLHKTKLDDTQPPSNGTRILFSMSCRKKYTGIWRTCLYVMGRVWYDIVTVYGLVLHGM